MNWDFITMKSADGSDAKPALMLFANQLGLETIAPGRYSFLLVLQLFGGYASRRRHPRKVIREIEALEGIGASSRFKPPIQNKHPPLKGLWHKHFMQDDMRSLAINFMHGLKRYGMPLFEQRAREAAEVGETRYVSVEDVGALTHDIVNGNLGRLSAAQALTGEWLLFAKHQDQNYYLSLALHDKSMHGHVRQQIDAICLNEFPFLDALLHQNDVA
jgi:hypothetical protein